MPLFGGVVDRAAEHVENAPIHRLALKHAKPLVELLRITALEIGHPLDGQGAKICADGRADAGNPLPA